MSIKIKHGHGKLPTKTNKGSLGILHDATRKLASGESDWFEVNFDGDKLNSARFSVYTAAKNLGVKVATRHIKEGTLVVSLAPESTGGAS